MSSKWPLVAVLIVVGLQVAACGQVSGEAEPGSDPARLEAIEGTNLNRVILSAKAAERLGIESAPVTRLRRDRASGGGENGVTRTVVPYSALLYDAAGDTWVYTEPERLVFVRHRITVDYIEGDWAVLVKGPPLGTPVVKIGAAELFGTEFEFAD